jgi:hypothetical protein
MGQDTEVHKLSNSQASATTKYEMKYSIPQNSTAGLNLFHLIR